MNEPKASALRHFNRYCIILVQHVSPANYIITITYGTIIVTMKPPFSCDNINHVHVYVP